MKKLLIILLLLITTIGFSQSRYKFQSLRHQKKSIDRSTDKMPDYVRSVYTQRGHKVNTIRSKTRRGKTLNKIGHTARFRRHRGFLMFAKIGADKTYGRKPLPQSDMQ